MPYYVPVPQQHQAQSQESQSFPWRSIYFWSSSTNSHLASPQPVPEKVPVVNSYIAAMVCHQWPNHQQVWVKPGPICRVRNQQTNLVLTRNLRKWKGDVITWSLWLLTCTSIAVVQTINLVATQWQQIVSEKSYWEVLPGFEKKKGVSKGEKQLEGKSKFRNRSPCLIR